MRLCHFFLFVSVPLLFATIHAHIVQVLLSEINTKPLFEQASDVIVKIEKQVLIKNVHIEESKKIAQSMLELRHLMDETIRKGSDKPSLNEEEYKRCSKKRNCCITTSFKVYRFCALCCHTYLHL